MQDNFQDTPQRTSPFDAIRHADERGNEYWSARELYKMLGYSSWQKFQFAIEQAKKSCENSGYAASDHFNLQVKMVAPGSGAKRKTEDYRLSRYACYLVVQNADSEKPIVALGQTYFAVQTRKQELAEQEHILDFMGSEKLADNIFRVAQTDAKIRRERIQGKSEANQAYYEVGRKVRQTIKDLGGTMPEDLPTLEKSIQQLRQEKQFRLQHRDQLALFEGSPDESL